MSFSLTDCPDLNIDNAIHRQGVARHASTVIVKCSDGYTLVGQFTLMCDDGVWNSTAPICRKGYFLLCFLSFYFVSYVFDLSMSFLAFLKKIRKDYVH